jgi:hypothetical protein
MTLLTDAIAFSCDCVDFSERGKQIISERLPDAYYTSCQPRRAAHYKALD